MKKNELRCYCGTLVTLLEPENLVMGWEGKPHHCSHIISGQKYSLCELCSQLAYSESKRCDRCWELESRIQADPYLAQKILDRAARDKS